MIFLEAVPELKIGVLIPVAIGAVLGLLLLTHLISYLLKNFNDQTISSLTGFIAGSLLIIWPWKIEHYLTSQTGELILKKGKKIVVSYERFIPDFSIIDTWYAIAFMVAGVALVLGIEMMAKSSGKEA